MSKLLNYYDDIKAGVMDPVDNTRPIVNRNAYIAAVRPLANKARHDCHKKILLNIYMNIHPLDNDYVQDHSDVMAQDVDAMLNSKYPNSEEPATMYLKSAAERTNSPLIKHFIRAGDNVYSNIVREAEEHSRDEDAKFELPTDADQEKEVDGQLVDIEKDLEYEEFIDRLRNKTISKIVNDVSAVIDDEKHKKDMTFNTTGIGESTRGSITEASMYYLTRESYDIPTDTKIALAIREAAINQFDRLFENPEYHTASQMVSHGRGYVINKERLDTMYSKLDN